MRAPTSAAKRYQYIAHLEEREREKPREGTTQREGWGVKGGQKSKISKNKTATLIHTRNAGFASMSYFVRTSIVTPAEILYTPFYTRLSN